MSDFVQIHILQKQIGRGAFRVNNAQMKYQYRQSGIKRGVSDA